MNGSPGLQPSMRLISLAMLLGAVLIGIIALSFASPRYALADAGGAPTNTPKPTKTPTTKPTATPTETSTPIPTLQGGGVAVTANVAPLLYLATTQAAIIPTTTPLAAATGLRSTPALLCAAFAVVLILIVIIVALWLLGRSTPGSGLPTEAPPGY